MSGSLIDKEEEGGGSTGEGSTDGFRNSFRALLTLVRRVSSTLNARNSGELDENYGHVDSAGQGVLGEHGRGGARGKELADRLHLGAKTRHGQGQRGGAAVDESVDVKLASKR